MTNEMEEAGPALEAIGHEAGGDDRAVLALAAGIVAALVAGGVWAALVMATDREIGWLAWGVGALVGWVMSRVTTRRTRELALAAAVFAVIGLVAGRAFIFVASADSVTEEIAADDATLSGAVAWQLYESRELDAPTLAAVDAVQAAGDTLPDELWSRMQEQGAAKLATMSPEERLEVARAVAEGWMGHIGLVGGIRAQLSAFDLLWLFLAVGTAYGLMAPPKRAAQPEPADIA